MLNSTYSDSAADLQTKKINLSKLLHVEVLSDSEEFLHVEKWDNPKSIWCSHCGAFFSTVLGLESWEIQFWGYLQTMNLNLN